MVNDTQHNGSTPLHAAAFYGHLPVVELLLSCGADPTLKNGFGNTPLDEARTGAIKSVIKNYRVEKLASLRAEIPGLLPIVVRHYKGRAIARRIERPSTGTELWHRAWHGTKFGALSSIYRHGLQPSGSKVDGKLLKPPDNHYKLGKTYFNVSNWAAAIFVSPTILYAGHPCYAERVMSDGKQWACLVEVRVRPGKFTDHDPTTSGWEPKDGEPNMPEWRIPVTEAKNLTAARVIQRVGVAGDVAVTAIALIEVAFLDSMEDEGLTFEALNLIL